MMSQTPVHGPTSHEPLEGRPTQLVRHRCVAAGEFASSVSVTESYGNE